jgi:parvulin-like peptidyl-prolyl isomerase
MSPSAFCLLFGLFTAQDSKPEGGAQPPRLGEVEGSAPSGIVAIVGDDAITRSQLDREVRQRMRELEATYPLQIIEQERPKIVRGLLEDMIRENLILQEFRRTRSGKEKRPEITDEQVQAEIADRIKKLKKRGILEVRDLEDYLELQRKTFNLGRDEVFKQIREDIMIKIHLWESVFRNVDRYVRPGELRHYYERNRSEFSTPIEIGYVQIFLLADGRAAAIIEDIRKRLKEGEDFKPVARDYSQESAKGEPRRKPMEEINDWVPPIPETLRRMKVGEVAGPLRTEKGYHFFKLLDRVEGDPKGYEELLPELTERILTERRERVYTEYMKDLRARSRVEVFLPEAAEAPEEAPASPDAGAAAPPAPPPSTPSRPTPSG